MVALRSVPAGTDRVGALRRAGAIAVGSAAGLAAFLWVCGTVRSPLAVLAWTSVAVGWQVFPVPVRRITVGIAVAATLAVAYGQPLAVPVTFVLLGVVALLRPGGRARYPPAVAVAVFGCAALIASYDNNWHRYPWPSSVHTTELVLNLGMIPFTAAAFAGVGALRVPGTRLAGAIAAVAGVGWVAVRTIPDLLFWGPSLLLVPAGAAVLVLARVLGTNLSLVRTASGDTDA